MKRMPYVGALIILGLSGCATVSSSLMYSQGTEAMEKGDFERAAKLLQEAVRLDPNTSRNQNNLAAALFELDRINEGWPHVRKAVQLDSSNGLAVQNCTRYLLAMFSKAGLNVGASRTKVVEVLGEPDIAAIGTDHTRFYYCASPLDFDGERLKSIGDLKSL